MKNNNNEKEGSIGEIKREGFLLSIRRVLSLKSCSGCCTGPIAMLDIFLWRAGLASLSDHGPGREVGDRQCSKSPCNLMQHPPMSTHTHPHTSFPAFMGVWGLVPRPPARDWVKDLSNPAKNFPCAILRWEAGEHAQGHVARRGWSQHLKPVSLAS